MSRTSRKSTDQDIGFGGGLRLDTTICLFYLNRISSIFFSIYHFLESAKKDNRLPNYFPFVIIISPSLCAACARLQAGCDWLETWLRDNPLLSLLQEVGIKEWIIVLDFKERALSGVIVCQFDFKVFR